MRISDWSSDVCSSDLGQRCTNARRLIVKQAMAEPLIEEVRTLSGRLIVDHPHAEPAPYMGPVIDNEAADGLTESFLILMSNGGQVIRHMTRPVEGRPFLPPGIIDVDRKSTSLNS